MSEKIDQHCGNCIFFKPDIFSGRQVGIEKATIGKPEVKGLCTARYGWRLGVRREGLICKHPEILFEPKNAPELPPAI